MKTEKRQGYISWDEAFMQIARLIAQRSKDPSTQAGACIVNDKKIVIGLGYNGFPRGCSDEALPWDRDGENMCDTKYAYVVHAEENAVLNTASSTDGATLYCTLYPCNNCAKVILQKGIKEIVYESDKYHDKPEWVASRRMLELAGITCRQYVPENELILQKK